MNVLWVISSDSQSSPQVFEVPLGAGMQLAQSRLFAAMQPIIRKLVEAKVEYITLNRPSI